MRRQRVFIAAETENLQDMTYRDYRTFEGVFYSCSYVLVHLQTRAFSLQKVGLHHLPRLLAITSIYTCSYGISHL